MARQVFLKLAARNLRRQRRRSLITLAAVSLGLASLVFLWGYVGGTNHQMIDNITNYLTGHLEVHQRGFHNDPELDLAFGEMSKVIDRVVSPSVLAAAPRIEGKALISGPDKTRGVLILGVDSEAEPKVTTIARAVKEGSYLDDKDGAGILLGDNVAETLRVKVGDEVALVVQASDGSVGAGRYRVRGIYDSGIDMIDAMYVFMTLPAAQQLFSLEGRITTLAVRLADIDKVPRITATLQKSLGNRFEALGWRDLAPGVAGSVGFHDMMASIVLTIVFAVVALGIANTILMSVLERTREFGVMMALGTQRGHIARVVLYEALLLALVGIALGLAVGGGVVAYLGHHGINHSQYSKAMQTMPGLTGMVYPTISAMQLVWLSLLVLGTTVAASIYPALKAARLTPIEAIRGARQVVSGKWRILRKTVAAVPMRAVFARIALQGLARNPRRAVLTLSALGAGLAAFLFLSALAEGLYLQMRTNATDLLTGHLQVEVKGFRDELDPKLTLAGTDELLARLHSALPAATMAPRMQTQAMVSSTTQSEPVVVYGVDPTAERTVTRLDRQLSEGSYLNANSKREIVIGTKLAERLGVRLGEKIVMMAPSADGSLGSAALRVTGIYVTGNDRLDRSMTFVSLATARELLGVPREASTIVLHIPAIETVDEAAAAASKALTAPGQQIATWKTLLPEVVQMLDLLRIMLKIILIVVFGVVALGVANTLLMAVLERTREFGLQLALGTRPTQIVRTVLYESLLLGVLGLGLGAIMGGAIVAYYHTFGFDLSNYAAGVASVPGMSTIVYPTLVFGNVWLPVLALFISSIIAALYPAWRAAHLDAVQALKHV